MVPSRWGSWGAGDRVWVVDCDGDDGVLPGDCESEKRVASVGGSWGAGVELDATQRDCQVGAGDSGGVVCGEVVVVSGESVGGVLEGIAACGVVRGWCRVCGGDGGFGDGGADGARVLDRADRGGGEVDALCGVCSDWSCGDRGGDCDFALSRETDYCFFGSVCRCAG